MPCLDEGRAKHGEQRAPLVFDGAVKSSLSLVLTAKNRVTVRSEGDPTNEWDEITCKLISVVGSQRMMESLL